MRRASMKNLILLVLGIVAVATVMLPLNYNLLTDYYKYTIPIKNSYIYPNFTHIDSFQFKRINDTVAHQIFDISLIDKQTVKISFRNYGDYLPPYPINDFEDFERVFKVGDNFVGGCKENLKESTTYLTIFQFNGTREREHDLMVDLVHADGIPDVFIPCNYPEIVDYSINAFEIDAPKRVCRLCE